MDSFVQPGKMMLRSIAILCFLLITRAAAAVPADTGTDPSLVIDKHRQHFVVNRDGSFTYTLDMVTTIVEPRAVQANSQRSVSYNTALEEIVAIKAHTQKRDGRIVRVTSDQIKDQQESASSDAPMFRDTRVKVVVFPDVEVGDKLVLHFVRKRHAPLFPGHFEDLSASEFYDNKQFDLIYDMPASMPLYADAVGFAPVPIDSPAGRKRYQWRYVDGPNQRLEADSVSYFDYGKRLAVSTFAGYPAFAQAYHGRAGDKARANPAITSLASKLTGGIGTRRDKALALADWVRKNIRYVAVYVGPGGVVPHAASTVLENRYGDCKDHAVLLEALLSASGIASTPALINSGNAYRLPSAPTLGIFDHVITYIPELKLYLDSTAAEISPGYLPVQQLGKPVLLTKTGTIATTPATQPLRNHTAARYVVAADGKSQLTVTKTTGGAVAEQYRRTVRDTPPGERDLFVERMLQGIGKQGSGVFDPGKLDGDGDEYVLGFKATSENFINLPGPTGVATTINYWVGLGDAVYSMTGEKDRTQDFVCPSGYDVGDEAVFEFAEAIEILAVPTSFKLRDENFEYDAEYHRKGNSVEIKRRLRFNNGSTVCTPADFKRMQPAVQRMVRDLQGQIIVKGS
ncbi:DUF3857 domain-containing transglutaminase family protein [Massilia sp. GCM10020059]|uniref:DUF3857 domain-containing protein n=1 Tax=Massilia agrisoli TaxID=2892444 RepID=A0ABS8INH8_9BURK|nr:DUF3857 domain-containing protein [Massilia agrisoli]MCC6069416.1 DUF3857 domain-containing protein [Massilia agrisoli]